MAIPDNHRLWFKGHVDPWWSAHRDLGYVNEPFNDKQSLESWRALGYTQTKFTGDMYDMRNAEPHWIDAFRGHFDWRFFSWSVYRMTPGCVLPNHSDTYAKFIQIYQIQQPSEICRAVIFLEDWSSGHYFEIDHTPITQWYAGDYVVWNYDVQHLAANMGHTDRYTLQITGVPSADIFTQ